MMHVHHTPHVGVLNRNAKHQDEHAGVDADIQHLSEQQDNNAASRHAQPEDKKGDPVFFNAQEIAQEPYQV